MSVLPRFSLFSFLAGLSLVATSSLAQTYATGFAEAKWETRSGAFACSLSQPIPGFGEAYFSQKSGGAGVFEFRNARKSFPSGPVRLEAVPPAWRNDLVPQTLATVVAAPALRLSPDQINILTRALGRGTNVVFTGANTGGDSLLRVVVDARHFEANYSRYRTCVKNLITDSFEQLSRLVMHYGEDASVLSAATKAQLDRVVRYTKADPKVLGILLDAHSDERALPEEAEQISQQQAELVSDYLVAKGLPASFITARWHGSKFPIADNRQASGKRQNRRVTLRLENEATRKDMWRRVAALRAADEKAAAEEAAKTQADAERPESASRSSLTPEQLEQLVERQNLHSGKQPQW